MQLILQLIFRLCLSGATFLIISGCINTSTLIEKKSEKIIQKSTNQKIFMYSFESVWRATQLSLRYPIAVNNMDHGILETDWIKARDGFQAPDAIDAPSAGIRYKISINMVKGKIDGKESVRVNISKSIERQRDFFSEPEVLSSDGLEEMVIFYRIEREIIIEEGLKKAAAKN